MNSKTSIWSVQNNSLWKELKTDLNLKGMNLIESPSESSYSTIDEFLFFTDNAFVIPTFKSNNIYKILLVNSKSDLLNNANLLYFDELIFKSDINKLFLNEFLSTFLSRSESKFKKNKNKNLQIQNLKSAENELQNYIHDLKKIQLDVIEDTNSLGFDLQKNQSLLKFILLLSKEMEISKILGQVWKDLIQIHGTQNIFLIQANKNNHCRFYYKQQGIFLYKMIQIDSFSEEASFNSLEWTKIITQIQNKQTENFFAFPLHNYFKNKLSFNRTMLLVENQYNSDNTPTTIKLISERLPFISMAIEKSRISDELITKNKLWENTFDGITDPLIIVDNNYKVIRSNQAFNTTSPAKVCYSGFTGSKKPCDNCPLPKTKSDEKTITESHSNELYFHNKIFLVNSYPLSKAYSNKYFINHYSEVSKERELLVKTLHVEKMRSLDSFADQLSTNLKKPLQAINEALLMNPILETCPDAVEIKKAVLRSELVLNNLTDFAKGNPKLSITAIDPLIEGTLPFYKSLSRTHKIYMKLAGNNIQAKVSPSLFQQVIFNLVNNACQAMVNPGSVTISSSPSLLNNMRGISIEIVDTGPGIPEHLRENIFKSAFTTKDIKKGTGLGLKICQFIINSFQGFIEYHSLPSGSKFWIWIPEEISDRID